MESYTVSKYGRIQWHDVKSDFRIYIYWSTNVYITNGRTWITEKTDTASLNFVTDLRRRDHQNPKKRITYLCQLIGRDLRFSQWWTCLLISAFRAVTQCGLAGRSQRLGGTYLPPSTLKTDAVCFSQNAGIYPQVHMVSQPGRPTSTYLCHLCSEK
jgi:hypothetical protein